LVQGEPQAQPEGVAYEVTLKGATEAVHQLVASQPWVSAIQSKSTDSLTNWTVSVSDPAAAENELFRLLAADAKVIVTHYHIKEHELEEVFLRIVEGGGHGD